MKAKEYRYQITSYNERYSSQRAERTIRMSGAKEKRQNKALVDTVSAAISPQRLYGRIRLVIVF